jgi:NADPH:quinone reductase-like Zn-dependent oxidoreductase
LSLSCNCSGRLPRASGALKPVIDRTIEFDEMVEVHRYLENSSQFGKIVVTV